MKLNIYTDLSAITPENIRSTPELLRAFVEHRDVNNVIYHDTTPLFERVHDVASADVCVLPFMWDYYLRHDATDTALAFVAMAQQAGKLPVIWDISDFGAVIPTENALILRSAPYGSRRKPLEYALPAPCKDYVGIYTDGKLRVRQKQSRPVVGFCGQGGGQRLKHAAWTAKSLWQHVRFSAGRADYYPPPLVPPTLLREQFLARFASSPAVETNFIVRHKYWNGVRSREEREDPANPSKQEFVHNIVDSDYVLCVRGNGNFSKRFYETLCLGRIPVFVNTDCVLPYDYTLDWRAYCVWVESSEIGSVAERVAAFHDRLSDDAFADLQLRCRQLWLDRLSLDGFYRHFHEIVADALSRRSA